MGNITRSPFYQPIDQMLLQHSGFVDVFAQNYFSPINWSGRDLENGTEMGVIMNQNMKVRRDPCSPWALAHRMLGIFP